MLAQQKYVAFTFSRGEVFLNQRNEKPWKQHHDNKC
jgi:hypothetical protein